MRVASLAVVISVAFPALAAAATVVTLPAGSGLPVDGSQPTLAMVQVVATVGVYPSRGGSLNAGDTLGMVHTFAGTFGAWGQPPAQGQLIQISQNTALFSVMGTSYGGTGVSTFALPDLGGRLQVGIGVPPGLAGFVTGEVFGSSPLTLTQASMTMHAHGLTMAPLVTTATGSSAPLETYKPSLAMTYMVALNGIYPTPGGGVQYPFIGQVRTFTGDYVPDGWALADGSLLSIGDNTALFSVLGTTFGGDGVTTFALPDLRGRVAVGTGPSVTLGQVLGAPSLTLASTQLAQHVHALPAGAGSTQPAGGSAPVSTWQPALGLTFMVALQGIYPARDSGGFDSASPTLGEVVMFAGDFAPRGFSKADGALLPISQNTALFSLLGTTWGGNGTQTFGLPDLRGRAVVGVNSANPVGQRMGADTFTLLQANLPPHVHTFDVADASSSSSLAASSTSSTAASSSTVGATSDTAASSGTGVTSDMGTTSGATATSGASSGTNATSNATQSSSTTATSDGVASSGGTSSSATAVTSGSHTSSGASASHASSGTASSGRSSSAVSAATSRASSAFASSTAVSGFSAASSVVQGSGSSVVAAGDSAGTDDSSNKGCACAAPAATGVAPGLMVLVLLLGLVRRRARCA